MTGKKAAIAFTLCLLACFVLPGTAEADKPSLQPATLPAKTITVAHSKPAPPEKTVAVTASIPLPPELAQVLYEACEVEDVPPALALAVIAQESGFNPHVVSPSGCYGLMQLNPAYFPAGLSPADNIRAGVGYLGELLAKHSTTPAAVTEYFYGPSERESSWYSDEVQERKADWQLRLEATK